MVKKGDRLLLAHATFVAPDEDEKADEAKGRMGDGEKRRKGKGAKGRGRDIQRSVLCDVRISSFPIPQLHYSRIPQLVKDEILTPSKSKD